MERKELIRKYINLYVLEHSLEDKDKIEKYIGENIYEVNKQILWKFEQVFRKAIKLQKEGKKGKIALITLSFLNSSLVNGKAEVQINLYDKNGLFDKVTIEDTYTNDYINSVLKSDIEAFNNYIKNKVIRITYIEKYTYIYVIMKKYREIFRGIFGSFINLVVMLESFDKVEKEDDFKITFGEFYCKGLTIYEGEAEETI